MIVNKIVTGFVMQSFDTDTKCFVSQVFVAGEVDYEDEDGVRVDPSDFTMASGKEAYLPFNMVQPKS